MVKEANLLMVVQYDGRAFSGWQRQQKERTVQGEIEKALKHLLRQDISIHGSGRTDAGVHAYGQCFTFHCDLIMPLEKLTYALNHRLPSDIWVESAKIVEDAFHARYKAKGKTYQYKILNACRPNPFDSHYSAYVPRALDEKKIREAMDFFLGTHDFKGFMASGSSVQNTVRTIYEFTLERKADYWIFNIHGNGFLYNMVRIIIGLLLQVGQGYLEAEKIPEIIKKGNRFDARWTAPAQGLYLMKVHY